MRRRVHGRLSLSSTEGTARPGPTAERLTLQTLVVDWAHNEWDRWRKFLRVFRKSRLGMLGLILLLIFVFMAVSAPLLTGLGLLRNQDGRLCGVDLHPCAPTEANLARYIPPNGVVWLGTDHLGRDIFARLWWGTQITILIGFLASVVSMGLGTFVGLVAGYYGGWIDEILMRITDFFLVLPTIVLALILVSFLEQSGGGTSLTVAIVIGITLWAATARLVRSQALSLKQRQFVDRARAIGASQSRIAWRHVFPNAFSLVFAEGILTIAVAILTESFLSYLGLGPDANTWGKMIEEALQHSVLVRQLTWWIITPGLAIVGVVLGFTLLGYALDEIVNPRLRRRWDGPPRGQGAQDVLRDPGGRGPCRGRGRLLPRRGGVPRPRGGVGLREDDGGPLDHAAAPVQRPDRGRLHPLHGVRPHGDAENQIRGIRWRHISIIFQGAMNALNPVKRVGGQIAEPIILHEKVDSEAAQKRVGDLLELVRIHPDRARDYPHEVSGGIRQRVMIAMALACNPR